MIHLLCDSFTWFVYFHMWFFAFFHLFNTILINDSFIFTWLLSPDSLIFKHGYLHLIFMWFFHTFFFCINRLVLLIKKRKKKEIIFLSTSITLFLFVCIIHYPYDLYLFIYYKLHFYYSNQFAHKICLWTHFIYSHVYFFSCLW